MNDNEIRNIFTKIMKRNGIEIEFQDWRHLVISLTRTHFQIQEQGIGLRFDEQSGHSSNVANRIYGRNTSEILSVAESIEEEFYYTLILWHIFLNVSLNVQLPFNY